MLELILASQNKHKVQELNQLLGSSFQVSSPAKKLEVDESADTFSGNAKLKAMAYFMEFRQPAVSDDSGIIVDALPNELGVRSARFAPQFSDYKDKNDHLLEKLHGLPIEKRTARYVCDLCFVLSKDEIFHFEGRLEGLIGLVAKGSGGFGYDPIFYPKDITGQSIAELADWKAENSHRAKASALAKNFFQSYL